MEGGHLSNGKRTINANRELREPGDSGGCWDNGLQGIVTGTDGEVLPVPRKRGGTTGRTGSPDFRESSPWIVATFAFIDGRDNQPHGHRSLPRGYVKLDPVNPTLQVIRTEYREKGRVTIAVSPSIFKVVGRTWGSSVGSCRNADHPTLNEQCSLLWPKATAQFPITFLSQAKVS